ncbi:MAG: helix-turn-helix domain-containing protein [Firmicutes bacterium]|nr:helix-turn-helix domain-containing protein [Bacillota bacterium]
MEEREQFTKNFAEQVRLLRLAGHTQRELARELGIDENSIGDYCNGRSFPKIWLARKICVALNCSYEELFGELK